MDKLMETLVDELAKRVLEKLSEDSFKMMQSFRLAPTIKPENIEGLEEYVSDIAEKIAYNALKDATFSVECSP